MDVVPTFLVGCGVRGDRMFTQLMTFDVRTDRFDDVAAVLAAIAGPLVDQTLGHGEVFVLLNRPRATLTAIAMYESRP